MFDDRELVSYRHAASNAPADEDIRYIQYADAPLPEWAVDVEPYEEKLVDEY